MISLGKSILILLFSKNPPAFEALLQEFLTDITKASFSPE